MLSGLSLISSTLVNISVCLRFFVLNFRSRLLEEISHNAMSKSSFLLCLFTALIGGNVA